MVILSIIWRRSSSAGECLCLLFSRFLHHQFPRNREQFYFAFRSFATREYQDVAAEIQMRYCALLHQ